jgi:hypothetical protein
MGASRILQNVFPCTLADASERITRHRSRIHRQIGERTAASRARFACYVDQMLTGEIDKSAWSLGEDRWIDSNIVSDGR